MTHYESKTTMTPEMWIATNPITQWQQQTGHTDERLLRMCNVLRCESNAQGVRPMTFQCIASLKKGEQRFAYTGATYNVGPQDFWMIQTITGVTPKDYVAWLAEAPESHPIENCVEFWLLANPLAVLRSIMRVTQKQLTKKSAMSLSDVIKIEKGTCASLTHLIRVAHCMSIDMVQFVAAYVEWLQARPVRYNEPNMVLVHDSELAGYEKVTQDIQNWKKRRGSSTPPRWFKGQLKKPRKT